MFDIPTNQSKLTIVLVISVDVLSAAVWVVHQEQEGGQGHGAQPGDEEEERPHRQPWFLQVHAQQWRVCHCGSVHANTWECVGREIKHHVRCHYFEMHPRSQR